jgi:hypothetical protein
MTRPEQAASEAVQLRALCERAGVALFVFGPSHGDGPLRLVFRWGDAETEEARIVGAATAFTGDTERATRHMGAGPWERASVECSDGTLGVARVPGSGHLAIVSAPSGASGALVERLAVRAVSMMAGGVK